MFDALVAPEPCRDQAELLRAFDLPIALMQDAEALERITGGARRDEGGRERPLRRDPLGAAAPRRARLSLADGIAAGRAAAPRRRGRTGTEVRLIATALRSHDPATTSSWPRRGAGFRDGLTRLGPGRARGGVPRPDFHGAAFEAPAPEGLRITLHAGEWGGAAQVRRALEVDPERIAHGPGAIDDPASAPS